MARLYATTEQAWPTDPPADADRLLRVASRLVDRLLFGRLYDHDPDTLQPTDPDDVQALQDATVTIAHELAETGALSAGSTSKWESVGIGSVSLSGPGTSEGTVVVDGLPVPGVAVIFLADVGRAATTVTL